MRESDKFRVTDTSKPPKGVTEPARERAPMEFTEIYLAQVPIADFRKNPRGELGTRTATLHSECVLKLRDNWIYKAAVS